MRIAVEKIPAWRAIGGRSAVWVRGMQHVRSGRNEIAVNFSPLSRMSMTLAPRKLVKSFLGRYNRRLVQDHSDGQTATGLAFWDDLKLVIGRPDPLCLDVGANRGQTIELLQTLFPSPTIHAFEPSTAMFETLKLRPWGERVTLHPLALGNAPAEREFINYADPHLSSFLEMDRGADNPFRNTATLTREIVAIQTADDFLASLGQPQVDLLKIDTQGFDLEVLRGAEQSLAEGKIGAVLVELNFSKLYRDQSTATDIIRFLADHRLQLVDFYEKIRSGHTLSWCTALFARHE